MSDRPSAAWLPRVLFWLTVGGGGLLLLAVALAPGLERVLPGGGLRLVSLFAGDATVRRTSLGGGLGLIATAFIFFCPPAPPPEPREAVRPPPPSGGIGA